jgi:RHS repeat-associated protein
MLKRYGDNNNLTDNFNYQYYSGTNKLSKVSGAIDQNSYDLNGNVTRDTINYNFNIQYDHRNLITQLYHTDREAVSRPYTYATRYYYDESGNRVRKLEYFNTQTNPPLITDWNNPGNGWTLYNNEFYVKGADGKDLATYQGSELEDWYVWGNDLTGKIRKDKPYYYFKDHLGSVRAIVNEDVQIVAAFDYDAWGYPLEGRTYNADSLKFKYTGKELDKESLYDYFGARYYDSRIGRWGQVDPEFQKHIDYSPYNYVLNNPLVFYDPKGKDPIRRLLGSLENVINIIDNSTEQSYLELSKVFEANVGRYIYTTNGGFIDMKHFFVAAHISSIIGTSLTEFGGYQYEIYQFFKGEPSSFNLEDLYSNYLGAEFGSNVSGNRHKIEVESLKEYLNSLGVLDPDDPRIARDMIYIPEDENDVRLPKLNYLHVEIKPFHGLNPNYPRYFREFRDPNILNRMIE